MRTLLLGLALLTISSFAAAEDFSGSWVVSKRICADGAAPYGDGFQQNRDLERWTFDKSKMEFSYELSEEDSTLQVSGTYTISPASYNPILAVGSFTTNNPGWRNYTWNMSGFLAIVFKSPNEIEIVSPEPPPFMHACGNQALIENYVRQ